MRTADKTLLSSSYPHCYPFYQFDFITSSWKNSFLPSSSCLQSMHPNLKTILLKCAFCHQKKKIRFLSQTGAFAYISRTGAVPYIRSALGDSSGQKRSSSAPVAPVCMRCGVVPVESCHAPGEFSGTASAVPGSLTPHCCKKPKQGPPEGSTASAHMGSSTVEVRGWHLVWEFLCFMQFCFK